LFEPSQWADLFKRSGARYGFPTSHFHDGYCLWASPFRPGWNSRDVGPKRDLLGDFSRAMRPSTLLPALREIEPIVGQTIKEFLDFYLH